MTNNTEPRKGSWDIKFKTDEKIYRWVYKGEDTGKDFFVADESLAEISEDGSSKIIFDRN